MQGGTEEAAEHGLGAGVSIGRHSRVRPSKRIRGAWRKADRTENIKLSSCVILNGVKNLRIGDTA